MTEYDELVARIKVAMPEDSAARSIELLDTIVEVAAQHDSARRASKTKAVREMYGEPSTAPAPPQGGTGRMDVPSPTSPRRGSE